MSASPTSASATTGSDKADDMLGVYWERAYRFAAMITRSDQESSDIAQQALVKVWRQLDRFDPEQGSFDSWLWRIVLNVARDAGRAAGRRQALMDRLRALAREEPERDVEEAALRHLNDERLLKAVRRLSKRPRTVIALRFGAHLTYREIGEHLGMTEAAALMATRRALSALRKEIESKEALT
jgi:RNA polymerase sigma-70 factor (ECF subfamily)